MNPLQYTSEEMFSSTELIRKSKTLFDKLNNKEIEKAIILRDGKPSFMLLDFSEYEKLMHDYISLQESIKNTSEQKVEKVIQKKEPEEHKMQVEEKEEIVQKHEINEKDLEDALAEIDNLNLDSLENKKTNKESIKEFWE